MKVRRFMMLVVCGDTTMPARRDTTVHLESRVSMECGPTWGRQAGRQAIEGGLIDHIHASEM